MSASTEQVPDHHHDEAVPAVSRRHVLALARVDLADPRVYAGLPALLVLARYANHRTGLSRPTRQQYEALGLSYSGKWRRQIDKLIEAGLIVQTQRGQIGQTAEYHLVFDAENDTEGRADATPTQSWVLKSNTQEQGRESISAIHPGWMVPITADEFQEYQDLQVFRACSGDDMATLTEAWSNFRSQHFFRRLAIAVSRLAGKAAVQRRLTDVSDPRYGSYGTAKHAFACALSRLREMSEQYGIDVGAHPSDYLACGELPTAGPEGSLAHSEGFRALLEASRLDRGVTRPRVSR